MHRVAATALVASMALTAGCGSEGGGGAGLTATPVPSPPRVVTTANPAVTFAPLVHVHARETRFPTSASRFVERSGLAWGGGDCPDDTVAMGRIAARTRPHVAPPVMQRRLGHAPAYRHGRFDPRCRERGPTYASTQRTRPYDDARPAALPRDEGFFLDLLTAAYGGDRRLEGGGSPRPLTGVPAYFEREPATVDGRPGLRIAYWLLFAHDESLDRKGEQVSSHEGDWERVDVLLARTAGRDRYLPRSVGYRRDVAVPWPDVEVVAAGPGARTHPVVYAARGSHTPYPRPGRHERRVGGYNGRQVVALDAASACQRCPVWRTWDLLRSARREPWYGYAGAWGARYDNGDTSGSLGPTPSAN
jgi:hypothetical protein